MISSLTADFGDLCANFGNDIFEERKNVLQHGGLRTAQLTESPDAVQPVEESLTLRRGLKQHVCRVLLGQCHLRLKANAVVGMSEQIAKFARFSLSEAFLHQASDFAHERRGPVLLIAKPIEPPLADPIPTIDPVRDIQPAVEAEVHVGRQDRPEELLIAS